MLLLNVAHSYYTDYKHKGKRTDPWRRCGLKNGTYSSQAITSHRNRIPAKVEYLRQLRTDSAYISSKGPTESVKTYRKHIYNILLTLMQAETASSRMRIERIWPDKDWQAVGNPAPGSTKESLYRVSHGNVYITYVLFQPILAAHVIWRTHSDTISWNVGTGDTNGNGREDVWH